MSHNSLLNSTGTKNSFFQGDKSGQNSSEYGEIMIETHYSKVFYRTKFHKALPGTMLRREAIYTVVVYYNIKSGPTVVTD